MRMERFAEMDAAIEEFNATETTSRHGHNFMSDYTPEERANMSGFLDMSMFDDLSVSDV